MISKSGLTSRLIVLMTVILLTAVFAVADGYTTAWVICQPDNGNYVNARRNASGRSEQVGRFDGGDEILLDGKKKNGFLHCVGVFEDGQAWICAGYVVYEKPVRMNQRATVVSRGKLKARKFINGKRRCWLRNGDTVNVYWWTEEWCVTSKGFVQSRFLELEGG